MITADCKTKAAINGVDVLNGAWDWWQRPITVWVVHNKAVAYVRLSSGIDDTVCAVVGLKDHMAPIDQSPEVIGSRHRRGRVVISKTNLL